jgi:hypothetical protein
VTSIDQFATDLRTAGFIDIRTMDLTEETKPFVAARLATWRRDSLQNTLEYGEDAYAALETFYAVVARLFDNGSLGCVRLVASNP